MDDTVARVVGLADGETVPGAAGASSPTPPPTDGSLTVAMDVAVSVPASVVMTESSSNLGSLVSTPPTTIRDSASIASEQEHQKDAGATTLLAPADTAQDQVVVAAPLAASLSLSLTIPPPAGPATPVANTPTTAAPSAAASPAVRPRRARASEPTYNLQKLSGTDVHGKRRTKGDVVSERHQRRALADPAAAALAAKLAPPTPTPAPNEASNSLVSKTTGAAKKIAAAVSKPRKTKKTAKSSASAPTSTAAVARAVRLPAGITKLPNKFTIKKATKLGKRGRDDDDDDNEEEKAPLPRELRNLQDTNEFGGVVRGVEEKDVVETYWVNGKYVEKYVPLSEQPPRKKAKTQEQAEAAEEPDVADDAESVQELTAAGRPRRKVKSYLDMGLRAGQPTPEDPYVGLSTKERKAMAAMPEHARPPKKNGVIPFPSYNGMRMLCTGRDFKLPFDVCNPLMPTPPKPAGWRLVSKNRWIGDSKELWKKTPQYKQFKDLGDGVCGCKVETGGCGADCLNRHMLYECNDKNCRVGAFYCNNRPFVELAERYGKDSKEAKANRHRIGVDIVKTDNRGYGIRSNRSFEPGQVVMEYAGEIITSEECGRRMEELYKDAECFYLMAYKGNMIIDGTSGNMARFVNHSCEPNCIMTRWVVDGEPRMALLAGDERIEPGDELTYDYNFANFDVTNMQKCHCGSTNCRGYLAPRSAKRKADETDDDSIEESGSAPKKRKLASGKAKATATAAKKKTKSAASKAKGKVQAVFKKSVSTAAAKGKGKTAAGLRKTTVTSVAKRYTKPNRNGLTIIAAGGMTTTYSLGLANEEEEEKEKRAKKAKKAKEARKAKKAKTSTENPEVDVYDAPGSPTPPARQSSRDKKPTAKAAASKGKGKASSAILKLTSKAKKITKKVTAKGAAKAAPAKKDKGKGKATTRSASEERALAELVDARSPSPEHVSQSMQDVQISTSATMDPTPATSSRNGIDIPRPATKIRVVPPSLSKKD